MKVSHLLAPRSPAQNDFIDIGFISIGEINVAVAAKRRSVDSLNNIRSLKIKNRNPWTYLKPSKPGTAVDNAGSHPIGCDRDLSPETTAETKSRNNGDNTESHQIGHGRNLSSGPLLAATVLPSVPSRLQSTHEWSPRPSVIAPVAVAVAA